MPKKAPASRPREATTEGSPGTPRAVPAGSSGRSPATRATTPASASPTASRSRRWPAYWRDAIPRPASAAHQRRAGAAAAGFSGEANDRPADTTRSAPTTIRGSSPRNTSRQPTCVVTRPATRGPTSAGITHAVEKAPNNRGRSTGS